MAQTQLTPELYIEVPEPVRARHYEMNISADEGLRVLEAIYEIFYGTSAPEQEAKPTPETSDHETQPVVTETPIAPSEEVQAYTAKLDEDANEMELDARKKLSQAFLN